MTRQTVGLAIAKVAGTPSVRLREALFRMAHGATEEVEVSWSEVRSEAALQALVACDEIDVFDGEASMVARLRTK